MHAIEDGAMRSNTPAAFAEYNCDEFPEIELTAEEIKNRIKYVDFFKEKKLSPELIPFYPDARFELPSFEYTLFTRVYVGKKTLSDRKDYVIISVPLKKAEDTCCCIEPASTDYTIISRVNEAIAKECNIDVYNVHEKGTGGTIRELINNYKTFMVKKGVNPAEYPQAFTILDKNNEPYQQAPIIPLIPQRQYIQSCYRKEAKLLYAYAGYLQRPEEEETNLLKIPGKEAVRLNFSDCCQVPPMGGATITTSAGLPDFYAVR